MIKNEKMNFYISEELIESNNAVGNKTERITTALKKAYDNKIEFIEFIRKQSKNVAPQSDDMILSILLYTFYSKNSDLLILTAP